MKAQVVVPCVGLLFKRKSPLPTTGPITLSPELCRPSSSSHLLRMHLSQCTLKNDQAQTVLAGAVAQDAHQAGCLGPWSSQQRLAQLSPHRERLGQGGGSRTGGGQNSSATRESCHHIRGLLRSWYGSQTADPAAVGELRQAAGHTHSIRACTRLVDLCDPYLTQIVFADSLEVQEKNGSSGRTRTYNPPVNSRASRMPPIDSKGAYSRQKASKPLCLEGLADHLADSFLS